MSSNIDFAKKKFLENWRNGVYNELNGASLIELDLDDLITSVIQEYEEELVEVELDLERCIDEKAILEDKLTYEMEG
jgi:hypothetical protein